MKIIKTLIKSSFRSIGYDLLPIGPQHKKIVDPFYDIYYFWSLRKGGGAIIFDVGSNIGDSIDNFRSFFKSCFIYGFEPQEELFKILVGKYSRYSEIEVSNLALGSHSGMADFCINECSLYSSILEVGKEGQGKVIRRTSVNIEAIDSFCIRKGIPTINVLKIDTQGYDLEVLRGALRMIRTGKVEMILVELIFSNLYNGQASFTQICDFLLKEGYSLVRFYDFHFLGEKAQYTDALFILDKLWQY